MDCKLIARALERGIILGGLETEESIINLTSIFSKSSPELADDGAHLQKIIDDFQQPYLSSKGLMYLASMQAWQEGDVEQTEKVIASLSVERNEAVLEERNRKWMYESPIGNYQGLAEKLEHDESVFIAVGFLHLFGKKGLVTLLKSEGFTVTRIDTSH